MGYDEEKLTIAQFLTLVMDEYTADIEDYREKINSQYDNLSNLGEDKTLSPKEIEKKRKECQDAIKYFKQRITELEGKKGALSSAMSRIDAIAKDDALIRLFRGAMYELDRHNSKEEEKLFVDTLTLWRQAIKKGGLFKSKEEKEEIKASHKKETDKNKMGEVINSSAEEKKSAYVNKYDMGRKLLGRLSEIAAENNIYFDDMGNRYYNQREDAYVSDHPSIEMSHLEHVKDFLTNPVDYYSFDVPGYVGAIDEMRKCLRCIDVLKEKYLVSQYSELEKYAKATIQLAREIEYVDRLLITFDVLPLNKSSIYLSAREVSQKQKEQYGKLLAKTRELMAKENFKGIIEAVERLEQLYLEAVSKYEKLRKLNQAQDEKSFVYPITDVEKEIRDIEIEMHQIAEKYPQLAHRPEFFSILNRFNNNRDDHVIPEEKESKDDTALDVMEQILDEREDTDAIDEPTATYDEETLSVPTSQNDDAETLEVEEANLNPIDLPVNLQIIRTQYYQKYMMEKLKKSPLGKIPFSEFLEEIAPEQKELIAIEKQREKQAETIYKKYIKHRLAGANIGFREYCNMFYSDLSVELPVAHEEEEAQRSKR